MILLILSLGVRITSPQAKSATQMPRKQVRTTIRSILGIEIVVYIKISPHISCGFFYTLAETLPVLKMITPARIITTPNTFRGVNGS